MRKNKNNAIITLGLFNMEQQYDIGQLPEEYRQDIQTAVDILKGEGCNEIYLFGSLAKGNFSDRSDVDLAVTGMEKSRFFKIFGKLLTALDHPVDLVNLEKEDRFSAILKRKGNLIRVA
ncbi:MAG: nucleotidyltransferase family protein [Candidatus Omnitrophota bacterium]